MSDSRVKGRWLVAALTLIGMMSTVSGCSSAAVKPPSPSLHLTSFQLATEQNAAEALELVLPTLAWPGGTRFRSGGTVPLDSIESLARSLTESSSGEVELRLSGYDHGAVDASFLTYLDAHVQQSGSATIELVKLGSEKDAQQFFVWLSKNSASGAGPSSTGSPLEGAPFSSFYQIMSSPNPFASFTFASGGYFVKGLLNCEMVQGCDELAQSFGTTLYKSFSDE